MTHRWPRITVLTLALTVLLSASNAGVTRTDWQAWLEREAGTPPAAARCVANRAFSSLPEPVLEAAPRLGFSTLPGGWRERIAESYIACVVETG